MFYLKGMVGHSESMDTLGIYGVEVDGEMKKASMILADVFETLIKPKTKK